MLSGQRPSQALMVRVSCAEFRNRTLDLFDDRIGMTVGERDAGCGKPCRRRREGGAGLGRGLLPSGSLQPRQRARSPRRRRFVRGLQTGIPGIAADPRRDADCDEPGVFERGGEHAGTALAEVIVAAAAIDPANARLKADAAAKSLRAARSSRRPACRAPPAPCRRPRRRRSRYLTRPGCAPGPRDCGCRAARARRTPS